MSNGLTVIIKYIDDRLRVTKGESADCYADISSEDHCSVYISPCDAIGVAHVLGTSRKYLESAGETLLDGAVSQEQYAAILGSIESALCGLCYCTVMLRGRSVSMCKMIFVAIPVVDIMSGDCEKIIVLSLVSKSVNRCDGCVAKLHDVIPYYDGLRVEVREPAPDEWSVKFCKHRKKRATSSRREIYRFGGSKPASEAVIKNLRLIASFKGNHCKYFDSMDGLLALEASAEVDCHEFMYDRFLLLLNGEEIFSNECRYGKETHEQHVYYHKENESFYYEYIGR